MTHVAIYVRVSTIMQADKFSLPMQRQDLISYCAAMLSTDSYEVFEDAGFSGKNTDRPAYKRMMDSVRAGRFSHVLVWKLDRISRNLLDFAQMYAELRKLGVTFISRNEAFDTSTAMGEAMLKIILVFAELERHMTAERVTATMLSRASSGKWNGGPPPYGYIYDKDAKTFEINPEEKAVVAFMMSAFKQSHSFTETARRLNNGGYMTRQGARWEPKGIKRILTSPFTYGCYLYNATSNGREVVNPESKWVVQEDHHPPLFPHEDKEEVERIINGLDRRLHTQTSRERPFRRLVFCDACGKPMYPGGSKPLSSGYTPAMYRCHNCQYRIKPYLGTVSDTTIGRYVIPILSGLARVQEDPSLAPSPASLERLLLRGSVYSGAHIDPDDLSVLYRLLGGDREDMEIADPPENKDASERVAIMDAIRVERRALERLQHIYLYDDNTMSEQEYVRKNGEITAKIASLEASLAELSEDRDESEEYMASHLLMKAYLLSENPDYLDIVTTVSIPVLQEYLQYTLKGVYFNNKKMTRIILYSGVQFTILYPDRCT